MNIIILYEYYKIEIVTWNYILVYRLLILNSYDIKHSYVQKNPS